MDISIIKNAVDDKFIQSIIDVGESQELEEATIGGESNTSNNIRSTKISWIMDKTILLTLKDKMFEINKSKNWNYNLTDMFPFQYSVYHENDHYNWHVDIGDVIQGQKEIDLKNLEKIDNTFFIEGKNIPADGKTSKMTDKSKPASRGKTPVG